MNFYLNLWMATNSTLRTALCVANLSWLKSHQIRTPMIRNLAVFEPMKRANFVQNIVNLGDVMHSQLLSTSFVYTINKKDLANTTSIQINITISMGYKHV